MVDFRIQAESDHVLIQTAIESLGDLTTLHGYLDSWAL